MILMYHNVDDKSGFNTVSAENFKKQLSFLKQNWHITDLNSYILNKNVGNNIATITFDDAYSNIYTHVLPIIQKLNIPISVFVPALYVNQYNTWDSHLPGFKKISILDWQTLSKLSENSLFTFGSHGLKHTSFRYLSEIETIKELKESKLIIEENLKKRVKYFAFPYGQRKDLGFATAELLRNCDYEAALTTLWGRKNKTENQYFLRRVEVKPDDSIEDFKHYISTKIDLRLVKQKIKDFIAIR